MPSRWTRARSRCRAISSTATRLVTAEDFEALTLRTPGVDIGRVEILPAFHHPDLSPNLPGDAAGVVTVLVLPAQDPVQPDAPVPDQRLLGAVACWLEPRRLVTTELVLARAESTCRSRSRSRFEVVAGMAQAEVRDAVKGCRPAVPVAAAASRGPSCSMIGSRC